MNIWIQTRELSEGPEEVPIINDGKGSPVL